MTEQLDPRSKWRVVNEDNVVVGKFRNKATAIGLLSSLRQFRGEELKIEWIEPDESVTTLKRNKHLNTTTTTK